MQLIDSSDGPCGIPSGISNLELGLVWPSNSPDDIVRRYLAAILLEDPDHRLRVAHLEPLLHLHVGTQTACSSGRLQALLTDPSTARIFSVDFSNTRATEWRSRVVYLDLPQLLKEVAAAKQQAGSTVAADYTSGTVNNSMANGSSAPLAGQDAAANGLSSNGGAPTTHHHMLHSQHASSGVGTAHDGLGLSSSLSQQPLMLESIFAAGFGGNLTSVPGDVSNSGAGGVAPRRDSGSTGGAAGGGLAGSYGAAGSVGAGDLRVSLFGSSFEVPHAIASCWAGPSSCGSGAGSVGTAVPGAAGPGKGLDQHDNCGGSSTASASSTRSVSASTRAAASRLRKASSNVPEGFECGSDGAGHELTAVSSPGGLSGLDVSTPKSAVVGAGDASASPVHSSAGEDDVEYNEAQLVFGLSGNMAGTSSSSGNTAAAAASSGAGADEAQAAGAQQRQSVTGVAAVSGASGASNDATPVHGVDWARVAALQQQQHGLASHFGRLQQPGHQQALLFGSDEANFDVPGSAPAGLQGNQFGQQQHQQHVAALAAAAQQQAYASSLAAATSAMAARRLMMDQAAGFAALSPLDPAAPALFSPAQHRISVGSAPATGGLHDLFLHAEHASMFAGNPGAAAAAAAAVTGAAGFGFNVAAATAAQLAESVLLEGDGHAAGSHQLQLGMHSGSYGSSSGGGWRASPAAASHLGGLQQHAQLQHHRPSDPAAVDVSLRSDQGKDPLGAPQRASNAAAAGAAVGAGAGAMPAGKPGSFHAASAIAAAPAGAEATGAGAEKPVAAGAASLATPCLTGWASIAAKEPKASPGTPLAGSNSSQGGSAVSAWANGRPLGASGGAPAGAKAGAVAADGGKPLGRLPQRVRNEVQALVAQFNGVLKVDDFDEGVVHQLNAKRSEEEAVAAVRHIAHYDLANIQHMAAYLNHLVKHYNHTAAAAAAAAAAAENMANGAAGLAGAGSTAGPGGAAGRGGSSAGGVGANGSLVGTGQLLLGQGSGLGSTLGASRSGGGSTGTSTAAVAAAAAAAGGNLGAFGGQIRLASVPVSTKAMLQKLPLKVFRQLEQLVAGCAYLEWRHFDAGVVKVLAQLSKLCEADVFEELELLAATDLSNVEYMPAYLNKRLNNKLWSRRKAEGHVPSG